MVLYSICKVELLSFLHQGKNTDSGFSGNMTLRNIFGPTTFQEWYNGENYIGRSFSISVFSPALQHISSLGRLFFFFLDFQNTHTHTHIHTLIASRTPLKIYQPISEAATYTTHSRDEYPYPQWDSKGRSQQQSLRPKGTK